MSLLLVGMSHRSAPVAVRERHSVAPEETRALNEKLIQQPLFDEAVLLCTCNRTEIVAVSREPDEAFELMREFLCEEIGDGSAAPDQVYGLRDGDAVSHLFRVAASLDSMVVGEAQILGQVKDAYRAAVEARSCGPLLSRLFQRAFRAAKRIRSETGLGSASVSLARVGVQLAREIFEGFDDKRVLLLGAGEMAESALAGLRDAGVQDLVIVNRTLETAVALAGRLAGRVRPLDELERELESADIALTSVQVAEPILGADALQRVMDRRSGEPLLLIDLGLPRNVDPVAQQVENVYLYDIDDLEEIAERGRANRVAAVAPAERIVAHERDGYERWRAALKSVPTIVELREQAEALAREEALRAHGDATSGEARERLAQAIVAKILHRPLERLRAEAEEGAAYYNEAVRWLFGLEEEDE